MDMIFQKIKNLFKDFRIEDIIHDKTFMSIYSQCKPYTMTSIERAHALYDALKYIISNQIEGDFVECGVWKGGSSMMMAIHLKKSKNTQKKIFLYDTFKGMPEPQNIDRNLFGSKAKSLLMSESIENGINWCYSTQDQVAQNMRKTGLRRSQIKFIKGKVEDTIPNIIPKSISLLRLDTDWYSSTYHELVHLYPLLTPGGVLIIDDYGHWEGARKAVDQYFKEINKIPLLQRIDYTGRLLIKT